MSALRLVVCVAGITHEATQQDKVNQGRRRRARARG